MEEFYFNALTTPEKVFALYQYAQYNHEKFKKHFSLEYCKSDMFICASRYPTLENLVHITNSGCKTSNTAVENAIYVAISKKRLDVIEKTNNPY